MIRNALASATLVFITACSSSPSPSEPSDWKIQELAVMAQVRCLVTGGHMNRNEGTKFIAQINKEQSGQFQRVYDSIYKGVSKATKQKVESLIKGAGGCRKMINDFIIRTGDTFQKISELRFILKPIQYPDENNPSTS